MTKATLPRRPDQSAVAECQQLFRLDHGSCSEGTVAVARHARQGNGTEWRAVHRRLVESKWTLLEGVHFERGTNSSSDGTMSAQVRAPDVVIDNGLVQADISWSAFYLQTVSEFGGIGATLSLQQPYFETGYRSISGARISYTITYWTGPTDLVRKPVGGGLISASFSACPSVFGDSLPRFYIYWGVVVSYSKEATGNCYNMDCPGYTHVSPNIVLGGVMTGTEMSLFIQLDFSTRRYNLFSDQELVGFWNADETLFWRNQHFVYDLGLAATAATYSGGLVIPSVIDGMVTSTHMGTGKFPSEVGSAYLRNIVWHNLTDNMVYPVPITDWTLHGRHLGQIDIPPRCYDAYIGSSNDWGTFLQYGGRGRENPACRLGF